MRSFLDIPAGVITDETLATIGQAAWADCDGMRFYQGRAQTRGGWEKLVSTKLTGVCRTVFPWKDKLGALVIAFGTHSALQVYRGAALYDITPTRALPAATLGANPLSVTNTSAVVTVTQNGHPHTTADSVIISGASAVGGITPNGTFPVTVVDVNTWTYTFTSAATATAVGGGSAVVITPQKAFAAGAEHGTGTAGYSTGAFSVGAYSSPSANDYFARTWALDSYGESLMANPRGGPIYWWQNDTAALAAPLAGSPASVGFMLVNEQRQVMAFSCNQEKSGIVNPLCIRFSDIENPNSWATTSSGNAGEVVLKGGGRIVAARAIGPYVMVWTDNAVYLGTFIGDPSQTWRFEMMASKCGLMGANAVVVVNQTAYWPSPAGQFFACGLGGGAAPLKCTVRKEFIDNLTPSQLDKVVASSCAQFSEIRFDYPDIRDGYENSRYVAMCTVDGAWSKGRMARSAYCDADPAVSPIGVAPTGEVYWHERGNTADGSAFSWFIESADQYIDSEHRQLRINDVEPDIKDQRGAVTLTMKTRSFPQSPEDIWDPITLAPGETFQDFRAEGRFVRVRLEGNAVPSSARMGRMSFDVSETGRR